MVLPTGTEPKLMLLTDALSVPDVACVARGTTAQSASAISTKCNFVFFRWKGVRSLCGTTLVSGETATLIFFLDSARGPLDCIPPSGYGQTSAESTEQERRFGSSSFAAQSGNAYLYLSTGGRRLQTFNRRFST